MAKTTTKLTDLLAQRAALEKQITAMQRDERGQTIAQVKALMAEYGLTPADVLGGGAPRRQEAAVEPAKPAGRKRRGPSPAAGKKVAPKYRNPATGDTWTGRGLKPRWLAAALASGRALSEFAI